MCVCVQDPTSISSLSILKMLSAPMPNRPSHRLRSSSNCEQICERRGWRRVGGEGVSGGEGGEGVSGGKGGEGVSGGEGGEGMSGEEREVSG